MSDFSERFSALLEARTGIHLNRTNSHRIEGVLRARAETLGFPTINAYVDDLSASTTMTEMQTLVNLVTVGKTSFYRYPDMVSAIVDKILPAAHRVLPQGHAMNIWSAGCSTGEEPYTIAMALTDAGWFAKRRIRMLATDINTNALEHARAGRYTAVRVPDNVKRHVTQEGHIVTVAKSIRDRVVFERLNLAVDPFPDLGSWHIVICANVLIYFGPTGAAHAVERLVRAMSADAALFLGGAENLSTYDASLSPAHFGKSFAYLRGAWSNELASYRMERSPEPGAAKAPGETRLVATPPRRTTQPSTDDAATVSIEVDAIISAAAGDRHGAVVKLTALRQKHPNHAHAARALAMLLFNERRFEDACDALEDAIAADPLAFDLHYYSGWLFLALNDVDSARQALRRALFLEPGFTFARYELALTMHRAGHYDEAVREYARAEQAASDPRVRDRLRERSTGSRETFWINDSFIVELCRGNKDRARQRLSPLASGRLRGIQ